MVWLTLGRQKGWNDGTDTGKTEGRAEMVGWHWEDRRKGWNGVTDTEKTEGKAEMVGLTLRRQKGWNGGTDTGKTEGLKWWDWHWEDRRAEIVGLTLGRWKSLRGGTDTGKTKGLERWDQHSEDRRDGTVGLTDTGKTEIQIHLQETPAHEEDLVTIWSVTTQVTLYRSGQPEPATHKSPLGALVLLTDIITPIPSKTFSHFLNSHQQS